MAVPNPTIAQLASIMRYRTEGALAKQGVFNTDTNPTATQATEMLALAVAIILPKLRLGKMIDNTDPLLPVIVPTVLDEQTALLVEHAALFKTAILIEGGSERETDDNNSIALWQSQYDEIMDTLMAFGGGRLTSIGLDSNPLLAL